VNQPELWLARHGETDWSAAGRHTGRTDVPLNDNGRVAATALARILRGERFDLVLTSPLLRARQTCALAGFEDVAALEPNLHEWDYGDYEGVTTAAIRETRPGWTPFTDGCPGGETLDEVAARADRVIARVRQVEGRVLAFGHGHALRILAARWIDATPAIGANLVLGTATISVLGWERETPAIHQWNAR
jgi:broad specificity phosphatase PhoE